MCCPVWTRRLVAALCLYVTWLRRLRSRDRLSFSCPSRVLPVSLSLRYGSKRDYAAPLIVFELNYATGNRADNDVDDEEEDEASSAVIQPLPARPPAPGPPAPAGGLERWRVGGSSPSTVPVRRGGGGGVGSGREVLQAAGGRALQVAPGAGKTLKQQQYPAPHPHATLGLQVGGASSQARQGDARTQMD